MKNSFWWLVAAIVLGAGLGLRDPWPPDEPRFVLVVRDMVASGDWLFPRVAGVLYPDKPPLYFWTMAVFCHLTGGVQRIAFLLPSLVAGLATLALVKDLGRRLWNPQVGFAAAAALLLTIQFTLQARSAQIDMTVCLWITLGMYGLARHLLLGPDWRWYGVAWVAMGAGIMTKGVGFLPLLALIPYAIVRARRWPGLPALEGRWRWWIGPALMLATLALWLVPMLIGAAHGGDAFEAYRDNILFRQTAVRYAAAWHHHRPPWHYAEVIAVLWLPLVALLPWLAPAWKHRLTRRDPRFAILLGWIALVLLFFTLSPGKRDVYVLPALPMFALAAAPFLPGLIRRASVVRLAYVLTAAFAAILAATLAWFTLIEPDAGAGLVDRYGVAPWSLLIALAVATGAWLLLGPRNGVRALAGAILSAWLVFGWYGLPIVNPARTAIDIMARAAAIVGDDELALADWKEQLVLFANRPVHHFGYRRNPDAELLDAIDWLSERPAERWLLVPGAALQRDAARDVDRDEIMNIGHAHREDWYLIPGIALRNVTD